MTAPSSCPCFGCAVFCQRSAPQWGAEAARARIRLAFEMTVAAECASRGIPTCGPNACPHGPDCGVRRLHDRIALFAIALAAVFDDPCTVASGQRLIPDRYMEMINEMAELMVEIGRTLAGKPRIS